MTEYELVLRGEIGDHFGPMFDGMRLERTPGRTVLTGPVRDQAQLLGLIDRIQELGIELVSINPLDDQGVRDGVRHHESSAASRG